MQAFWRLACSSEPLRAARDELHMGLKRAVDRKICFASPETRTFRVLCTASFEACVEARSERIRSVQKRDCSRERVRKGSRTLLGLLVGPKTMWAHGVRMGSGALQCLRAQTAWR